MRSRGECPESPVCDPTLAILNRSRVVGRCERGRILIDRGELVIEISFCKSTAPRPRYLWCGHAWSLHAGRRESPSRPGAMKGAVEVLRDLGKELGPRRIGVDVVATGVIEA